MIGRGMANAGQHAPALGAQRALLQPAFTKPPLILQSNMPHKYINIKNNLSHKNLNVYEVNIVHGTVLMT